jgi:transposase, IS30 family
VHCLSIVERQTGLVLVRRVWGKTSALVTRALVRALKPLARWVRSITTDNGSEFARWRKIERALRCKVYASEPHKPWQRGLVEHTNGLIRQYFPKGSDAACLSAAALKHAQEALNHRPRVRLEGSTPWQVFYDATGVAIQS